ncbi:MAG: type I glyceraldehyde-3-phosphate dehydrogenase [Candidatus Gracilibacteria bacterium]|jgi:glyceraldehyde 3-phosphate dehydrogenase|nr:type I glyceraldehyde-3-phosphate dehydrogenase [Candidatus Gracilibacteria bacterium]
MKTKVAINGFGRIGRQVFRINLEKNLFDIVAINDLTDNKTLAHLLKYDSTYGTIDAKIETKNENEIIVNGKHIKTFQIKDPELLPWKKLGVDLVIESTGVFRTKELLEKHLKAGAKKVLLSAPAKDPVDITMVMGVNEKNYKPARHHIISNASCTTNCLAPLAKVIHDNLKIKHGFMTTCHSYTNDQRILDLPHSDLRRARAAGLSMIPTTTGAAKSVAEVIPSLKGKLNGTSIRVPTPTVSIVDFVCVVEKKTTAEKLNAIFKKAATGKLKGIMSFEENELVSIDFKKNENSSIIDAKSTMVIDGNLIKVLSWYDNEWGYSCRIVDMVKFIADKKIK